MTAKETGESPGEVNIRPAYLKETFWNFLAMFDRLFPRVNSVAGDSLHSSSQLD